MIPVSSALVNRCILLTISELIRGCLITLVITKMLLLLVGDIEVDPGAQGKWPNYFCRMELK